MSGVLLSFVFLLLNFILTWFLLQESGGLSQLEREIFATFFPAKEERTSEVIVVDSVPSPRLDLSLLTEEQQKIISCIHQGMVYKEIASIIGKSESHVKRQMKVICTDLGIEGRVRLSDLMDDDIQE